MSSNVTIGQRFTVSEGHGSSHDLGDLVEVTALDRLENRSRPIVTVKNVETNYEAAIFASGLTPIEATAESGETLESFKAKVLQAAKDAQRRTGVSGVDEFLRQVGIDPDAYKVKRTVSLRIDVQVDDDGQDVDALRQEVRTFTQALIEPFGGNVRSVSGGYASED